MACFQNQETLGPTAEATTLRVVKVRVRIFGRTPTSDARGSRAGRGMANSPGSDPGAERHCGFKSHLAHHKHAGLAEWRQATVFQTVHGGSIPSIRTSSSGILESLHVLRKVKAKRIKEKVEGQVRLLQRVVRVFFDLSPFPFDLITLVEMAEYSSDRLQPGSRG